MSWHAYWQQVQGNVYAIPIEAVITVAATILLARPGRWLFHRLFGDRADLDDLRRAAAAAEEHAAAARKIMADLFEHHTGRPHRDAPGRSERG